MNKKQLRKILKQISKRVHDEIVRDPNKFFTEADFQFWLYNTLNNLDKVHTEFKEKDLVYSKIHLEYPRFDKGDITKLGRFDISIIRNPRKKEEPFYGRIREGFIDYYPTHIAFELKAKWDITPIKIIKEIEDDLSIFDEKTLYDFGVLFHLSLNRNTNGRGLIKDNFEVLNVIDKLMKDKERVYIILIETYDDDSNPVVIHSMDTPAKFIRY